VIIDASIRNKDTVTHFVLRYRTRFNFVINLTGFVDRELIGRLFMLIQLW